RDADLAEKLREEMLNDQLPGPWQDAIGLLNRDDRIAAVLRHHEFYGSRCPHAISEEIDLYVNYFASQPEAMYARLRRFDGTSLAPRLLQEYLSARIPSGHDVIATLQSIRFELERTSYVPALTGQYRGRVAEVIHSANDPAALEPLCREMDPADKDTCNAQTVQLYRRHLDLVPDLHRKIEICDRMAEEIERLDCKRDVALDAAKRMSRDSSLDDIRLTRVLCKELQNTPCDHELKRKVFQWAAQDAFRHL